MREQDIMHENGNFWVGRERGAAPGGAYVVFKTGTVCSESDSAYAKTPDGLSIAVARCDYLAKREAGRQVK